VEGSPRKAKTQKAGTRQAGSRAWVRSPEKPGRSGKSLEDREEVVGTMRRRLTFGKLINFVKVRWGCYRGHSGLGVRYPVISARKKGQPK